MHARFEHFMHCRIIAAELLSKRVTRRYMYFDEMTACLFVCEIDKYNEVSSSYYEYVTI